MICPHCGKEVNTTTFVNPAMACPNPTPIYLNLSVGAAGAACANGCNPILRYDPVWNTCAAAPISQGQIISIKF